MTFSKRVKSQLFGSNQNLTRLALPQFPGQTATPTGKRRIRIRRRPGAKKNGDPWTKDEHERFLAGLEAYPSGPWKMVAAFVMTRTTRQTMTHAQKYRQKIERWQRIYSASDELSSLRPSAPENGGGSGVVASSESGAEVKVEPVTIKLSPAETKDSDAESGPASSPRWKNQLAESPSGSPIKFESLETGDSEEVASGSLLRSASYEAIDALLSNWQSLLSVGSAGGLLDLESLSDLHLDTETGSF